MLSLYQIVKTLRDVNNFLGEKLVFVVSLLSHKCRRVTENRTLAVELPCKGNVPGYNIMLYIYLRMQEKILINREANIAKVEVCSLMVELLS